MKTKSGMEISTSLVITDQARETMRSSVCWSARSASWFCM